MASVLSSLAASYDVAAIVWPAYQPEPRWAELGIFGDGKGEWQNVYECRRCDKPLWGYENEADPVVVARKIDAALAAGVNVFIYEWYWYGGRPFLENALDEGFLKAPNCERMKFYIMYANHDVTGLWNNKLGGEEKRRSSGSRRSRTRTGRRLSRGGSSSTSPVQTTTGSRDVPSCRSTTRTDSFPGKVLRKRRRASRTFGMK